MSLFERVVSEELEKNKLLREQGKDIVIPFPFERFSKYVPGTQKGRYIIVTANSKIGKTKITDYIYLFNTIDFALSRKTNIKPKIFYFTLEISKEDKMKEAIAHKLYIDKGITLSTQQMESLFNDYILEDSKLDIIKSYKEYFQYFEETVTFIDNIRNPFGIYNYMRDYAEKKGKYFTRENVEIPMNMIKSNHKESMLSIDRYEPLNDDEYVIVIVDNFNILTTENGKSLQDTIASFSNDYCLKMRDRWKYIIVGVQQQAAAQESVENMKLDKLQPSANGLGDCKLSGRDCDMMLGLFAPSRYHIKNYNGYDITRFRDNHRELSVILNRRGHAVSTQLYFNGAVNYFEELPKSSEITEDYYKKLLI